jgi:hypothetical protein
MTNAIMGGLLAVTVAECPHDTTLVFTITFRLVESNRPSQTKVLTIDAGQSMVLNLIIPGRRGLVIFWLVLIRRDVIPCTVHLAETVLLVRIVIHCVREALQKNPVGQVICRGNLCIEELLCAKTLNPPGPVGPAKPVPVGPVAPVNPIAPTPTAPRSPIGPSHPVEPVEPVGPVF